MFEPIHTKPERARVRVRDIAAAWGLVGLILSMGILPGAIRAASAEALRATATARSEIAIVLHSVPKLLRRAHQA